MRKLVFLCALAVFGCGDKVGFNAEPVEVSGRVTMKSRPVTGVVLNLQPTSGGAQAALPLKNGGFRGQVVPGRYTYYITEGASAEAFKAIPEKYHLGDKDRQIELAAGSVLNIALD